jgi:hypothetical protein
MQITVDAEINMYDIEDDIIKYAKGNTTFKIELLKELVQENVDDVRLDVLCFNIKNQEIQGAISYFIENQNYKTFDDLIQVINQNTK